MFKPTKLLKVVSIILIVFSVLGVLTLVFGYVMAQSISELEGVDQSLIDMVNAAYTPVNLVLGFGCQALTLVCGILGVRGKAFKAALGLMSVYIIIELISNIMAGITFTGTAMLSLVLSFILPILYLWGLYQSKE